MQNRAQPIGVDGFGDVVVGAHSHGLHCGVNRALRGNDYDGHGVGIGSEALQELESTHARHLHIRDDDGRRPTACLFQTFGSIFGGFSAIAPSGDEFCQSGALVFFILDN